MSDLETFAVEARVRYAESDETGVVVEVCTSDTTVDEDQYFVMWDDGIVTLCAGYELERHEPSDEVTP